MAVYILGIRHHGAGSARQVLAMLERLQPDCIFVEGPPEMERAMSMVGHEQLQPPVSVLCYDEALPQQAAFYPFAEFSPEWQAALYANRHRTPLRMMDLPLAISWEQQRRAESVFTAAAAPAGHSDPIGEFAVHAGYADGDLWWEHHFEQGLSREDPGAHFEAVLLMMQTLRESGVISALDAENEFREAWMADLIRKAQREMYDRIAVVCGAWHGPALLDLPASEKKHAAILKGLPKSKIKVGATWAPWTNDRLSFQSGYGAGLNAPGWYEHLWRHPQDTGVQWLTGVARLLREKKIDISTAHVIDSVRLAESLAALRERPRPGLSELNEATQTVMCMGDHVLLALVRQELVVGHRIGQVPEDMPKLPLQADFEEQCKKLRLKQTAETKELELDLREAPGLARSVFLHRLKLLNLSWARLAMARSKGTFKEVWRLRWEPEMMIGLIEKGVWGNTVDRAATAFILDQARQSHSVGALAGLIEASLPAELYEALEQLLGRVHELAAIAAEIMDLMAAVSPLAETGRYGNVRKTDIQAIHTLLEGLVARICVGLPNACYGLDDAGAQEMFGHIRRFHEAMRLLDQPAWNEQWFAVLHRQGLADGLHPLLAGCICRLLFDTRLIEQTEMATRFGYALSAGQEPAYAAAWIEGFLKGSGLILLYDDALWNLLYAWVARLPQDNFIALLPVLRRTFTRFEPGERRKLGEKAQMGMAVKEQQAEYVDFDPILAALPLPLASRLLGIIV